MEDNKSDDEDGGSQDSDQEFENSPPGDDDPFDRDEGTRMFDASDIQIQKKFPDIGNEDFGGI